MSAEHPSGNGERQIADVDVIVVHYHAASLVREAVAAVRAVAARDGIRPNIVVADNGSTPEEEDLLRSLEIEYLEVGRNAGYAGAVNAAFPVTRADFIILMNEDVIVLPGCLIGLIDALGAGAGVAGPKFFWDHDRTFILPCTEERTRHNEILKVGGRRSLLGLARARAAWREHARRHWRATEPIETTSLSGALLAFRRATWETVGPFDAGFHLYYEENDWLIRVEKAGLRCLYVPNANALHLHNPTTARTPERVRWETEAFLRFGNRYYGDRFMQRLLRVSSRESVHADWHPVGTSRKEMIAIVRGDVAVWPLWLELSPSASGYPAAAALIREPNRESSSLPSMRGLEFLKGPLYLQIVDNLGRELSHVRLDSIIPDLDSLLRTS